MLDLPSVVLHYLTQHPSFTYAFHPRPTDLALYCSDSLPLAPSLSLSQLSLQTTLPTSLSQQGSFLPVHTLLTAFCPQADPTYLVPRLEQALTRITNVQIRK